MSLILIAQDNIAYSGARTSAQWPDNQSQYAEPLVLFASPHVLGMLAHFLLPPFIKAMFFCFSQTSKTYFSQSLKEILNYGRFNKILLGKIAFLEAT